jgi:biopolymer transport protein ExbD
MSGSSGTEVKAEPNLTPMLDMVFQLVTFFMLVINFKAASLDLSLKLPVVGTARPVDTKGRNDLLILNIDSKGNLNIYGRTMNVESYIKGEAQASLLLAKKEPAYANLNIGDELPTQVVVRADRATPFRLLNRVIKCCQDNGFRHFALKAMNKEEGV